MMFCQKEEIDHVLRNRKGARDHLVSTYFLAKKAPSMFFLNFNFVVVFN